MNNKVDLDKIQKSLSNKQKKLFDGISPLIGSEASIGLISLQGVERTSQAEIEVIAKLITQFSPIKIEEFIASPRYITLGGQGTKGHYVKIFPQYKVKNINTKAQSWAIDLVLELHRAIGSDLVCIASIGVEYDGHPAHYVESNIKNTYQRDIGIVSESGIFSIRISPEKWKKDESVFKKAIKKYFEHQVKIIENVQSRTINTFTAFEKNKNLNIKKFVQCPVCNGNRSLANDFCPVCQGMGSVTPKLANKVNISEYEQFACPDCNGYNSMCITCLGFGFIDRDKAIKIKISKNNT